MEHKWLFILNLRSAIMLGLSTLLVSGSLFHTALGSPSPDDPHGIGFVTDAATWETIVEKAQKDDKPIFVDVYTAWCGPCKWMDQHVFNQREVGDYMNRIFINVKVDAEKGWGPEFKARFGVAAYPTYLFFSPEGDMVFSSGGSKPTMHFLADARHAIDNWQAGISSRGMEELLKNENADPARLKVYLDRLGGQDPRTSFLLDLYLTSLPEDSLTPLRS